MELYKPVVQLEQTPDTIVTSGDEVPTDQSTAVVRRRMVTDEQSKDVRNTVKISPLRAPLKQNDSKSKEESLNSSQSSADAKMILKHFEFLRIVLSVMTAYLCRRVLATGYGMFYFQVPYFYYKS